MIEVDISNIWGEIALPDLLAIEREIAAAHERIAGGNGENSEGPDWLRLPTAEPTEEQNRIRTAAEKIRGDSDVCVVVGIGGSYLGSRAAIELLQGPNRNLGRGKGEPQIFYAGNSLSTRHWNELLRLLEGKDFSVIAVSKSGATVEPAIALRGLRWLLERRYGTDEANRRVYAVTDPCSGALHQLAQEQGWQRFAIPIGVGGRFAALSPAGLLPMAVAGIDILKLLRGAARAKETYDLRSFENPVWLYAGVRNALYRKGKAVELLVSHEPGFRMFGQWWQQLFAQTEGKEGKGLFPASGEFPGDLHTLGQLIQQGRRNLFETVLRFDAPETEHVIGSDVKDLDGLNYLAGKPLSFVDEQACRGAVDAHVDGGVPVIAVDCGQLDEGKVGELFYFLQLACCVSACILGVDPFDQSGVVLYKRNMFELLGKPGFGS